MGMTTKTTTDTTTPPAKQLNLYICFPKTCQRKTPTDLPKIPQRRPKDLQSHSKIEIVLPKPRLPSTRRYRQLKRYLPGTGRPGRLKWYIPSVASQAPTASGNRVIRVCPVHMPGAGTDGPQVLFQSSFIFTQR